MKESVTATKAVAGSQWQLNTIPPDTRQSSCRSKGTAKLANKIETIEKIADKFFVLDPPLL